MRHDAYRINPMDKDSQECSHIHPSLPFNISTTFLDFHPHWSNLSWPGFETESLTYLDNQNNRNLWRNIEPLRYLNHLFVQRQSKRGIIDVDFSPHPITVTTRITTTSLCRGSQKPCKPLVSHCCCLRDRSNIQKIDNTIATQKSILNDHHLLGLRTKHPRNAMIELTLDSLMLPFHVPTILHTKFQFWKENWNRK